MSHRTVGAFALAIIAALASLRRLLRKRSKRRQLRLSFVS